MDWSKELLYNPCSWAICFNFSKALINGCIRLKLYSTKYRWVEELKNKYHNKVMIENLKRVQMFLIVDDIKIFLILYRLTFFSYSRMRLQDSWLVHLCIHIFYFSARILCLFFMKITKKKIDNFLQPCNIHIFFPFRKNNY